MQMGRNVVELPLSRSAVRSLPLPLESTWHAFFFDLAIGLVTVAWYILFLAEQMALRGLKRMERLATLPEQDCSGFGRRRSTLFHDEGPAVNAADERSFVLQSRSQSSRERGRRVISASE
jgi:hypothetical protein